MRLVACLVCVVAVGFVGASQEPTKYQGKTAAEWYAVMNDADRTTSDAGSVGLANIGPEATPYILQAFKSKIDHVRGNALVCVTLPWAKKEQKAFSPIILAGLKDESPLVRGKASWAAAYLMWSDCVAAQKAAYDAETDTATKEAMQSHQVYIKAKMK
jgi:hypothetical protein